MEINTAVREFIMTKMVTEGENVNLADTDSLIESGVVDSFGIMALISFLEEKFSIKITPDDLIPENFETIASITALVDNLRR